MLGMEQVNFPARINPLPIELAPIQLTEPAARSLGLREGQVVQALLEPRGESLTLLVSGRAFELAGHGGLRAGDAIWVKFITHGGKPALQVVPGPGSAMAEARALAGAALAGAPGATGLAGAALPADSAFAALSATVVGLLSRPMGWSALTRLMQPGVLESVARDAPPSLLAALQAGRLSTTTLDAAAIERAMAQAGLWTESWLARGRAVAPADSNKVLLRQLVQALGRGGAAAESIEEAVDEIERSQLETVQAAGAHRGFEFACVLPFRDAEPVELRFLKPARRGQEDPPWTVEIHTRSEELGELWLKTTVTDETRLDLTMWAIKPEVVQAARRSADSLRDDLEASGLILSSFVVLASAPPADAPPAAEGHLLDTRA